MAQQAVQDANSLSTQLLDGFAMYGMPRQTVEVIARGCMAMNGDVAMRGKMEMTGDLSTSIRQDNTASPLKFVQVQGDAQASARVAVLEIDGLILNKNLTATVRWGRIPLHSFVRNYR